MAYSASTLPTLLLDTSVISGLVNEDLSSQDAAAIRQLVEMAAKGRVTIAASTVSKEEIDRIPTSYRSSHLAAYGAIEKIRAYSTWVDTCASSSGSNEHPEYCAIRAILPDENDARLAFQGKMAGVSAFITVDRKTILSKTTALAAQGVNVASPSQYLGSTLGSV